jgi:hypothetical protein
MVGAILKSSPNIRVGKPGFTVYIGLDGPVRSVVSGGKGMFQAYVS